MALQQGAAEPQDTTEPQDMGACRQELEEGNAECCPEHGSKRPPRQCYTVLSLPNSAKILCCIAEERDAFLPVAACPHNPDPFPPQLMRALV